MAYNTDGTRDKPMGPVIGWFILAFIGAVVAIGIAASGTPATPSRSPAATKAAEDAAFAWRTANECVGVERRRLAAKGYDAEDSQVGAVMECGREIDTVTEADKANAVVLATEAVERWHERRR